MPDPDDAPDSEIASVLVPGSKPKTRFVFGCDQDLNRQYMTLFKLLGDLQHQIPDTPPFRGRLLAMASLLRHQLPYEEGLMQAIGYPRHDNHRREHDFIRNSLTTLLDLLVRDEPYLTGHQVRFVTDLKFHCKTTDNELIHYFNATSSDYAVNLLQRSIADHRG